MHRRTSSPSFPLHQVAPRRGHARRFAAATLLGLLALLTPVTAIAQSPLYLQDTVTDLTSEAVLSEGTADVEAALASVADNSEFQLWVVFVDSFDDASAQDWAAQTASTSSLGEEDVLLAVAVVEGAFAINAADSVSGADFNRTYDAADDALSKARAGDGTWAQAVVATAQALENSAPAWLWVVVVIGIVAVLGGVFLMTRRLRNRSGAATARTDPRQAPTAELVKQSGSALVAIDDELRTFEQEVGFAEAQFGSDATGQAGQVLSRPRRRCSRRSPGVASWRKRPMNGLSASSPYASSRPATPPTNS